MLVVVKEPGLEPEIREVNGISEINKIVGNIDEDGNGYNHGGSDIREPIGKGVDIYMYGAAVYNLDFGESNLWTQNNRGVICGTVVFAGFDPDDSSNSGACSLTEEQIEHCRMYIDKQKVNERPRRRRTE